MLSKQTNTFKPFHHRIGHTLHSTHRPFLSWHWIEPSTAFFLCWYNITLSELSWKPNKFKLTNIIPPKNAVSLRQNGHAPQYWHVVLTLGWLLCMQRNLNIAFRYVKILQPQTDWWSEKKVTPWHDTNGMTYKTQVIRSYLSC